MKEAAVPRGPVKQGYSFDDLLLIPQHTTVSSRSEVDVSTDLCPGVRLRIPVISANTQWCTGAGMAAAMALCGGLGFLHRMQTVDQQVAQLVRAKRHPLPGRTDRCTLSPDGRLAVGGAIGVKDDYLERADRLVAEGADILLVDVAHGHADYAIEALTRLRAAHPGLPLAAGNVATAAGVRDLAAAGAAMVKVGIGPGGVCTTRLVAGSGVPQMTAILDCAEEARRHGVTVIADGGIRHSGDIAKAIGAGADAVMLGSLLAGADESEALPAEHDGMRYKVSRGFATLGMENTLRAASGQTLTREQVDDYVPEGVESTFPASGPLARTLGQLVGGLRSGMSYSGSRTIGEFHDRAEFIRVTGAGRGENVPHALSSAPLAAPDYRARAVTG